MNGIRNWIGSILKTERFPNLYPVTGRKQFEAFQPMRIGPIQVKVRDGDLIESLEILTVSVIFTNNGGIIIIRHVSTLGVK